MLKMAFGKDQDGSVIKIPGSSGIRDTGTVERFQRGAGTGKEI
jgi:hypothetical protein